MDSPSDGFQTLCSYARNYIEEYGDEPEVDELDRIIASLSQLIARQKPAQRIPLMNPTEWDWIRDGTCDDPPVNGWFAVLLSYEEDGITPDAMQFRNGAPISFRAGNLVAHAGPFPDQSTAEAWALAHDPDWPD